MNCDWMDQAACRGRNPDIWFPEGAESAAQAKAICAGCPVRIECLEYAIETHTYSGVWGGLTDGERRRIRRSRRLPPRWNARCELCAKPFTASAPSARYCSQACRQRNHWLRPVKEDAS